MIVSLTERRYQRCLELGAGLERWLVDEAVKVTAKGYDVLMPAIGWEILRGRLFERCFTPRGQRVRGARTSDLGAVRVVTAAVNRREHHPALTGLGVPGELTESVPVWTSDFGDAFVYPFEHGHYSVLVPFHEDTQVGKVTRWQHAGSLNHPSLRHPIFDPDEHFALLRSLGSPSAPAPA